MSALRPRLFLSLLILTLLLPGLLGPAAPALNAESGPRPAGQSFLVVLAEQADLSPAYHIRDWEARGRFVLDSLRATAARTQPALLAQLRPLQDTGHVSSVRSYYIVNALLVQGDQEAAHILAKLPQVAAVYPNGPIVPIAPVDVDAAAENPQTIEWNVQMINADDVWTTYGTDGDGIVVANVDSGVEYTHPALVGHYRGNLGGGNFDHNYSWWDPTGQHPYPTPITGPYPLSSQHGTETMGTLVGDDGAGNQIGVAPGARWIAAYGFSGIEGLLSATEWMIAPWQVDDMDPGHPSADPSKRPHVVSNSWGLPGDLLLFEPLLEAQRAAGIFDVFAAGNNGENGCGTLASPADNPAAFAAGATDQFDEIAYFSSRGPNAARGWLDTYGTGPEVSAPGYPIRTSVPGGGYTISGGTSFATPHVAGTVALLWSAEPDLIGRVEETTAILRGTAVPKFSSQTCGGVPGSQLPNNTFGWGRLDALAAVEFAWQAGTLAGAVTDAGSGQPLAGAHLLLQRNGHTVRTTTDVAGTYAFPLGQGSYNVTVEAYGYASSTTAGVTVSQDLTTTFDVALAPLPVYTLSGVVREGAQLSPGEPVWAQLGLRNTPVLTTTDPAGGSYAVPVAGGEYQLRIAARGYEPQEQTITITGDVSTTVELTPRRTYYLRDSRSVCGPTMNWIDATGGTPLPLGFWDWEMVYDPNHLFPFYGINKSTYYISSLGFIGFQEGHPEHSQDTPTMIVPFEGPPNDVVYGFLEWLDPAYGGQGQVYYQVVGERYMVVEFYQVQHWLGGFPETFEFVLDTETGVAQIQYLDVSLPDWGTVGVENADGSDGLLYSYANSAGITGGLAVAFYPVEGPPPADQTPGGVYGALSGTVYLSGTTTPVPGAVVTAQSFLQTLTATTDPAGHYLFSGVCADLYTVQAGAPGFSPCAPARARLRWPGDVAVNDLCVKTQAPNPRLSKTVSPVQVHGGELFTYTLSLVNEGDGELAGTLYDPLPSPVEYVTSTPPGLYQDGTLTWTVELSAGARADVTVVGRLIPPPCGPAPQWTPITNTAYLLWSGPTLSASAVLASMGGPVPVLAKTAALGEVRPGEQITYTLVLTNEGESGLVGAVLSDVLPLELVYITSTPPGLYQDGALTWTIDLPVAGTEEVVLVGALAETAAPGSTVTNTAYLLWGCLPLSSSASFQVGAPGCRSIQNPAITWSPTAPLVGQVVHLSATVSSGDPPITFTWALGDGARAGGPAISHTYTLPNTYTVIVTATNCGGEGVAVTTATVRVREEVEEWRVYLPLVDVTARK